jgi:hypothetical protein
MIPCPLSSWFGIPQFTQPERPTPIATDPERIQQVLWRLHRAFEQAANRDFEEAALTALGHSVADAARIAETLTRIGRLIEELIQQAEQTYGRRPGLGAVKRRTVKSALVQILVRSDIKIQGIPEFAEPWLIEIGCDYAIDMIVRLLNVHDLWEADRQTGGASTVLSRLFGPLLESLASLLTRLSRDIVLWRNRLDPAVEQVIDGIAQDVRAEGDAAIGDVREMINVLVTHRDEVVALIDVVSIAVEEAETFISLSGEAKKIYATNLITAFLDDLGFPVPSFLIGVAIELVVGTFNRRQYFGPSQSTVQVAFA